MSRIESTLVTWKAMYKLSIPQEAMESIVALLEEDARKIAEWECRREVRLFAQQMESRLRANDHKPGWKQDDVRALLWRLWDEANELDVATIPEQGWSPADIAKEAADVANFAMMIADVCGGLEKP